MQSSGLNEPASRRAFLSASLAASASAFVLPFLDRLRACDLTTNDVLGPYWVQNAPVRNVLASADEPGRRLFISGRVFAGDCATPLEGTIVDVWHATDAGCYSVVMNCPDEDPFNLRGQMLATAGGEYAYETILPGYYAGRCRHIHLRISPPRSQTLVTQLYFAGDPRIPDDPFASDPDAAGRIIPLVEDENGGLHGVFDINLNANPAGADDESDILPDRTRLFPPYPNPAHEKATIRFQLAEPAFASLRVFDPSGRLVQALAGEPFAAGYHTLSWDGTDLRGGAAPSGMYAIRLEAAPYARTFRLLLTR